MYLVEHSLLLLVLFRKERGEKIGGGMMRLNGINSRRPLIKVPWINPYERGCKKKHFFLEKNLFFFFLYRPSVKKRGGGPCDVRKRNTKSWGL